MPRSSRVGLILLSVVVVLLLTVFVVRNLPRPDGGEGPGPHITDERLRDLRSRIDHETATADDSVMAYQPSLAARIDDLSVPAEVILRGLPGVIEVERLVAPQKPTRRIIHIRDLHFVPRDLFAIDVRQAAGRQLSDAEVEKLYEEHLLETELVQIEQMTMLKCLARCHGLRCVRIEGMTAGEKQLYRDKVEALKAVEEKEIARVRKQLGEVRELMRSMEPGTDRHRQAAGIEKELLALLDQHRPQFLEVGAGGRLLMAGELDEVLALDDERLLGLAKPVTPDGQIKFDPAKVREREDAQVHAALSNGPFALIVLGGAHDLSDSVRRVAGGDCEYIRVTTKKYNEFARK